MTRLIAASVAVLLGAASAQAQVYEPGYVVVDGTLHFGSVALGTEVENTLGVRFRYADGVSARYDVGDVSAFGADGGRQYRRGRFQTDPSSDAPVARQLFARVVRDGAADLLAVETVEGRAVFFVQTEGEPVGLYVVRDEVETGRGVRARERALYRQTLSVTLDGRCASAVAVEEAAYTERDLANVVDAYNRCSDRRYVALGAVPVRPRLRVRGEIGADRASGSFRRAAPGTASPDPGLGWSRFRAAAEVAPPFWGGWLRPVVGAEFERGVVRLGRTRTFGPAGVASVEDYDVVQGRLALRAVPTLAAARLRAEAGVLAGGAIVRRSETTDVADEANERVQSVGRDALDSALGQYVEVGVGPRRLPVDVSVRFQRTTFTGNQPVVATRAQYGTESVSIGVTARF